MTPVLEVKDLCVDFDFPDGTFHAVRSVSLRVASSETLCIVGESGCGKSLTSLGIVDLLPRNARRRAAAISFQGQELSRAAARDIRRVRGSGIGMVFQNPMSSLNPTMTVGRQLTESLRHHRGASASQAAERAVALLERVGITNGAERMRQYPHQLSGGLRQRVMIAMALMCGPELLIADEPTTALDVTTQAQILRLLDALKQELGIALIMVTHDLGVVSRVADRVMVMYAGEIVEEGPVADIFHAPLHPYTRGLLASLPVLERSRWRQRLGSIPGAVPSAPGETRGCSFFGRCPLGEPACQEAPIALAEGGAGRRYRCILEPEQSLARGRARDH